VSTKYWRSFRYNGSGADERRSAHTLKVYLNDVPAKSNHRRLEFDRA
jgi:hypothetical protein